MEMKKERKIDRESEGEGEKMHKNIYLRYMHQPVSILWPNGKIRIKRDEKNENKKKE